MTATVISLLFGLAAMAALVVACRSTVRGVSLALDLLERNRAVPRHPRGTICRGAPARRTEAAADRPSSQWWMPFAAA